MFCSNCGKDLEEGAAFCIYCGVPVNQVELSTERLPDSNGKGIASLVLGIISWLTCGGFIILPFIGLILGIFSLKSAKKGLATAGICLNASAFVFLLFLPLAVLLIPAVQASREAAKRMQCMNNEKHIGLALHTYHDARGALPPLYTVDEEGKPLHSWRVLILPHIEQQRLYEQIRLDEPWDSEHNSQFHDQMPRIFKCPSSSSKDLCSYSAIAGGVFSPAKEPGCVTGLKFTEDFPNGLSNTLAIVEVKEPFCWMDPTADVTVEELVQGIKVGSNHSGIYQGTFMDGSVRSISSSTSAEDLRTLATPGGKEEKKEEKNEE